MSEPSNRKFDASATPPGMSAGTALRIEYSIIALGIFALLLIFQPFSLTLFGLGCALVVLAGLVNNLLPICQPGVSIRSLVDAGLIVALIFCIVMLVAIAAAHLYGVFFVDATVPDTSDPFYRQPFVWGVAAVAVALACAVAMMRATNRPMT